MSDYVLDASALLALLNAEEGAEIVQDLMVNAVISAVNLAEVVTRLSAIGMPDNEIRETLALLGLEAVPFDEEQAYQAGFLYPHVRHLGLSLGDRACLGLAQATASTVVTADRSWKDLKLGIGIELIR